MKHCPECESFIRLKVCKCGLGMHLTALKTYSVSVLCSTCACIYVFTHHEQTPLHLAAKGGYWQCMELLLEYGAKLNVEDMQRRTPRDHIRGRPKCTLVVTHHIGKTAHVVYWYFKIIYPL